MSDVVQPARRRGRFLRHLPWRGLRRVVQLVVLALFLWLFRRTESSGADNLGHPANVFFRLDPLVGASAMVGARAFLAAFWPAAVVLLASALLGRAFCGWYCPLGTILDLFHRITRIVASRTNRLLGRATPRLLRPLRYVLLAIVLTFALFRLPIVGYLDPFSLLTRAATLWADPAAYRTSMKAFTAADGAKGFIHDSADRVYPLFRDHLLAFSDRTFMLAGVSLAILAAILLLEFVQRRFWCRYLCPLGAGIGLVSRVSPLRRLPLKSCSNCPAADSCGKSCRMGAFNDSASFKAEECTLCMDCVADCPDSRSSFAFALKRRVIAPPPVDLSRRAALITFGAGVAVPAIVKAARIGRPDTVNPHLIRPPGVGDDGPFLDLCVRCGLCMKVCTTNGLQPAGLQAGIEGIFSPHLVPRTGYCEYECTLCGQVCPTGAIPILDKARKTSAVIGKAVFDETRCLPWAKNEECICCEEHCPLPEKAIDFDEVQVKNEAGETVTLKRPFIHWDRCIGCGICENKCPLDGEAAVHVKRVEAVPKETGRGQGHGRGRGGGRGEGRGRGSRRGAGDNSDVGAYGNN